MSTKDWLEKDYYKVLGVSKDAKPEEIKKAFRKLARENHPDQHPGDAAREKRFKEVSEANSVLSDPAKRKEYDEQRNSTCSAGAASASPAVVAADAPAASASRAGRRWRISSATPRATPTSPTCSATSSGAPRPGGGRPAPQSPPRNRHRGRGHHRLHPGGRRRHRADADRLGRPVPGLSRHRRARRDRPARVPRL